MRRVLVVLTLASIGAAYVAGYWPERQARVASERALEATRADLERAEARVRLCRLQSQLTDLLATVGAKNFGEAQGKATAFFDSVRTEAGRPDQRQAGKTLGEILAGRDSVTVAITQNDPAVLEWYRRLLRLRLERPELRNGRMDRTRVRFAEEARRLVMEREGTIVACNLASQRVRLPPGVRRPAARVRAWCAVGAGGRGATAGLRGDPRHA